MKRISSLMEMGNGRAGIGWEQVDGGGRLNRLLACQKKKIASEAPRWSRAERKRERENADGLKKSGTTDGGAFFDSEPIPPLH